MTEINLKDVSLKFKLFTTNQIGIKEKIINRLKFNSNVECGKKEFWVLKDLNLNIRTGERVGIIGVNGAGKSTLLKLICGIYKPTKGEILVTGNVAPLIELGAGFNQELTGRENIYLNGLILGNSKLEMKNIEDKIIDFAGVSKFIDTPVKYYSTGMYMRLAFSIATEINPDILVIDELFAGGDINFINKAKKRMMELINKSNIMVMVSHNLSLIQDLCNRIIIIENSRVVYDGDVDEGMKVYLDSKSVNG